ncbi:MAG: hypothetical protein ACRCZ2_08870, partial [Fusobacteriaceae bacterium]
NDIVLESVKSIRLNNLEEFYKADKVENLVREIAEELSTVPVNSLTWEVNKNKDGSYKVKANGGDVNFIIKTTFDEDYVSFKYEDFIVFASNGTYSFPQLIWDKTQKKIEAELKNFNF